MSNKLSQLAQLEHDGDLNCKKIVSLAGSLALAGSIFFNSQVFTVASGGTVEILLQAAAIQASLTGSIIASGDASVALFEDPTFSAPGSAETLFNTNRKSLRISTVTMTSTPAVSVNGTKLSDTFINGGQRNQAFGGSTDASIPLLLKINEDYLLIVDNDSGATATIAVNIIIGEVPA